MLAESLTAPPSSRRRPAWSAWAILCLATALLRPLGAQARELSPSDLKVIERINQRANERPYQAGVWDCTHYALQKRRELLEAGFAPAEVRFALVRDERHEDHAVAEVLGQVKGRPVTVILDNRFSWTQTRAVLESYGYRWLVETP
jgi:predicted transglutaminase-like cysteine proteinase